MEDILRNKVCLASGLLLLLSIAQGNAAGCGLGEEIWAHDDDNGLRTVAYFVPPPGSQGPLIFEGWRGSTIQWRIHAEKNCSLGVVFCYAVIPLESGATIGVGINTIYEEDQPRYIVFSQLSQATFRRQVYESEQIVATWFQREPDRELENQIVLPSVYRFLGCQRGDELLAGDQ